MFKELGNLTTLFRQAQEMGGRMQAINAQLKGQRVSGSAGGGMVDVEVNGLGEVLRVTIDPTLVERRERDVIEDLVPAAVNQAVRKARELHAEAVKSIAGDLNVPGIDQALSKIMGGSSGPTPDGPPENQS